MDTVTKIYEFQKLFKNRTVYESQLYQRKRKINSMYVKYFNANLNSYEFDLIVKFIQLCFCDCDSRCENCDANSKFYAIIKKLETTTPFEALPDVMIDFIHMSKIIDNTELLVVDIDNLKSVSYTVENFNDQNYLFIIDPVCSIDCQ